MYRRFMRGFKVFFILTVLTGLVYPLAMTGLARLIFPRQAEGSMVRYGGRVVGSALIGQNFTAPGYFHGRPSAAGRGYDALASGGSNLGPTSAPLMVATVRNLVRVLQENPGLRPQQVPLDLVTASASGLDPDISPEAAYLQVPRVAGARGVPAARLRRLVEEHVHGRQYGFLGAPRVNVLELNLALDRLFPATAPRR